MSTPLPHHYDAHLAGGPTGYAVVSSPGIPDLSMDAPADFDGPGDAWSPEHLLVAAVQSCLFLTFRGLARVSKLEFVTLDVDVTGTVGRQDGVTRFTELVLRPRLVVAPGTDLELARQVLDKAEKRCLVSASLSTPIRVDPEIIESSGTTI